MKNPFKKNIIRENIRSVFSVSIDLNRNYGDNRSRELSPGGRYYFEEKQSNNKVSYETIRDFVVNVIKGDLSEVCKKYVDVSIQVDGEHEGSLVLVFSAIFNTIQFISGVKDVYDIAQLIRDLANERIEKRLSKEYGDYFYVKVTQRLPRDRDWVFNAKDELKYTRFPLSYWQHQETPRRDVFFWYLLISNIILFGILVLLTAKALLVLYW